MRMNEIDYDAQPPIDGYGPGGFRVAGDWFDGAVRVTRDGVEGFSMPLDIAGIAPLIEKTAELDLVLIGMGADIAPVPSDVRTALEDAGLGVEVMSTPSACRTYNVLLTEDRRVAAVLLPV